MHSYICFSDLEYFKVLTWLSSLNARLVLGGGLKFDEVGFSTTIIVDFRVIILNMPYELKSTIIVVILVKKFFLYFI